jgi:hypothetical protein
MWHCQLCEKEFAHRSSLSRHIRFAHQKRVEEKEEEEQMDEEEEEEEEEEDSESENEKDTSSEFEKEEEELSEEDARRSAESAAAWIELIQTAVAKLKQDGMSDEDLLSEQNFLTVTVPVVMELFDKRVKQCHQMKNSILYEALKEEEKYLVDEKGYSKWEAKLKALDNRKYLLLSSFRKALENEA